MNNNEETPAQNMITAECGGETFTYNPDTHTLVRDPNNKNQCILIVNVKPVTISGNTPKPKSK